MIVASVAVIGHAQRDGRSYVVELHRHDDGRTERVEYGPAVTSRTDLQAVADDRAVQINADRAAQETAASEESVARDKAAAVLAEAVTRGDLTAEELRRAGVHIDARREAAEVGEVGVGVRGG